MLKGCVPWPADLAARYRACGWWQGITIPEMLARRVARAPEKTGLAHIGAIPVTALRAHRQTGVRHFARASGSGK